MQKIKISIFVVLLIWNSANFIKYFFPIADFLLYIYFFFNNLFSFVCHKEADKLIQFGEYSTLLCSRCSGIYLGALTFSFINLFWTKKVNLKIKILLYSSIPVFIDVILVNFGFYEYSKPIAFGTGFALGFVGLIFLSNIILTYFKTRREI